MYKENLPPYCPLARASEDEMVLYRLFLSERNHQENYIPYFVNHPKYINHCKAYGISLFDSKEVAIEYALRNPDLGRYVAQVSIKRKHGKIVLTNKKTGHYTLWLYSSFDLQTLDCKIETINVS